MFLEGSTLEVRLGREELRLSLLGKKGERLLTSAAAWEPHEIDGVETYTLLMIWPGIRALWRDLSAAYRQEFGSALEETEKFIVRGMGGGYMPFDPRLSVLTAYRGAWDPCPEAAAELGLRPLYAPGLPGQFAPEAAAGLIWETAGAIAREREENDGT